MTELTKQKWTLSQFKSWLEGVEEMQGDEWSPNFEQWKKIRAKIVQLEENFDTSSLIRKIVNETVSLQISPRGYGSVSGPAQGPIIPGSLTGSNLDVPDIPVVASVPKMTTMMPGQPTEVIKTPNIDTSRQGYTTPFA